MKKEEIIEVEQDKIFEVFKKNYNSKDCYHLVYDIKPRYRKYYKDISFHDFRQIDGGFDSWLRLIITCLNYFKLYFRDRILIIKNITKHNEDKAMSNHVNLKEYIGQNVLVPKNSTIITKTKKDEKGVDIFWVEILTSCFVMVKDEKKNDKTIPVSISLDLQTEEEVQKLIAKFEEV